MDNIVLRLQGRTLLFVNLIEKGKHKQMEKNPNFECENKSMDMNLCVCVRECVKYGYMSMSCVMFYLEITVN